LLLLEKSLQYANDVVNGVEITTPEVKIQCKWFLKDYYKRQYQKNFDFYFDESKLKIINNLLKLLNFATGFVAGKQVLESLASFQCFLLANIFGWRYKENKKKFRYNDVTLFISRKNAKTALVAIIFILLMLTEAPYSEFYSICLTKEQAAEVRKAMTQILGHSPLINKHFKVSKNFTGNILCKLTNSFFQPRVSESGKNNSIRPCSFVSDEHANFEENSNFTAMKSGMKNVENPIVFRTTTAYAVNNSIFIEDLEYIRKVFNGKVKNERQFALLYYADEKHLWDDIGMYQSNPLRVEANYDEIREERARALEQSNLVTEYLTKSMNKFQTDISIEFFIDMKYWHKTVVDKLILNGKCVAVGIDASLTTDLTAVSIMYVENGKYYLFSHAFLPEDTLGKRREKIDYRRMEQLGYCTICKGGMVDYNVIEDYVRSIESKFGCTIEVIASDPANIVQTLQRLAEDYEVVTLAQTYTKMSPPIKSFRDSIYGGKLYHEKNDLLDWCVSNTTTVTGRTSGDVLLCKVNKNKTRIDMTVASVIAYSQICLEDNSLEITEEYLNNFYSQG